MRTALVGIAVLLLGCGSSSSSTPDDTSAGGSGGTDVTAGVGGSGGQVAGAGGSSSSGGAKGTGGATGAGGAAATSDAGAANGWTDIPNKLEGMSGCLATAYITSKPDEDMLIINVWQKGLWASTDGGASYKKLGTGAGSAQVSNGAVTITFDPKDTNTFWESGMYGPAAYKTIDKGTTFQVLGNIQHVDVMSVDMTDPERKTLIAGGHEASQKLYYSKDGGGTWTDIGPSLPMGTSFSSFPWVIDTNTFLVGCSGYGNGQTGVYRSSDTGATWTQLNAQGANTRPLLTADGTLYWPIIYNRGLLKSVDHGTTFTQVLGTWNILTTLTPVELPDGRLAAVSGDGNGIPVHVVISSDGGKTWKQVGGNITFTPRAFTYSKFRKAFYVVRDQCDKTPQLSGAMSLPFDYEAM